MPIKLEPSGFYEWHEPLNPADSLGVHTAKLEECIQYYHQKPFRGLFGHPSFGFDQDDLDFLSRTPDAREIQVSWSPDGRWLSAFAQSTAGMSGFRS